MLAKKSIESIINIIGYFISLFTDFIIPLPFNSVRFLTTQLVSEMGYAEGTHRQVLFSVGLVLYIFIMLINLALMQMKKRSEEQ